MKTHKTIQLAFTSGTGDCFFTKNNEFICVSRKDPDKHDELLNDGFKFMQYDEVRNEALKTEVKVISGITKSIETFIAQKAVAAKKRINHSNSDIYEFSDADPGL